MFQLNDVTTFKVTGHNADVTSNVTSNVTVRQKNNRTNTTK